MTLEQLQAQLDALPDERDIPTPRMRDAVWQRKQTLMALVNHVRHNLHIITETAPVLAAKKRWRDHLVSWRKTLTDRLMKLTPRDPAFQSVRLSIVRIDSGLDFMNDMLPSELPIDVLMREAGFVPRDAVARARGDAWFGCLDQVEREIKDLQQLHDQAQAEVDRSLSDAEVALAS